MHTNQKLSAFLPFPNPLTQKHLPLQFNTLVLSLLGCSDAIRKALYPNTVRKLIIKAEIKRKAEGCVLRHEIPHHFLDERCVSGPSRVFHD